MRRGRWKTNLPTKGLNQALRRLQRCRIVRNDKKTTKVSFKETFIANFVHFTAPEVFSIHSLTTKVMTNYAPYDRGGEWSFKNSGSRKILVEFHGSRSLVFQRLLCVPQSPFFIRSCLGVSIFRKAKGLEVPIRSSVSINDVFSSLE